MADGDGHYTRQGHSVVVSMNPADEGCPTKRAGENECCSVKRRGEEGNIPLKSSWYQV